MMSGGWRGIGVACTVPPRVGERAKHKHTRGRGDAHQLIENSFPHRASTPVSTPAIRNAFHTTVDTVS